MRILSKNQFAMSNFSREGYEFNEIEAHSKERCNLQYGAENAMPLLMSNWTMAEKLCVLLFSNPITI